MRVLRNGRLLGVIIVAMAMGVFMVTTTAQADRMTSSNYVLSGNADSAFGGRATSGNYGVFTTGGETIAGSGASGSYITGQGTGAQFQQAIQLTTQPGGLLALYNLDETGGTLATDSSATLAHGNQSGTGFSFTAGKLSGALSNDGSDANSRLTVPAASIQPASITVSAWVNATALNANDNIVGYSASGAATWGPWELYTDGAHAGHFMWSIVTGGTTRQIDTHLNSAFSTGTWYLLTATYDSATGVSRLFVNGAEQAENTFPAGALDYTNGNSNQQIALFNSIRTPGQGLQGAIDHVKILNRALTEDEVTAEYTAQNAGVPSGLSLGTIAAGVSNTALFDVVVRTDAGEYGVVVSQDHDLQSGGDTIPAISGSIASPLAWSEGVTKGLGFTLLSAPGLDGKWGSGANYAAFPGSATSFYTRSGHASSDTIDVIAGRLRLDVDGGQNTGQYSNTVTYTGTTLP